MDSVSKDTAEILFKEYPDIKKGYYIHAVRSIYHQCKFKDIALTRFARWYDEVDKGGFLTFKVALIQNAII